MSREEKARYEETDALREVLAALHGRKFKLDCGHHVTVGHHLGNDIAVFQTGKIICTQCSY